MADDYGLYRVRHGDRHSIADGTIWGEPGSLVEVPVYWAMDDWPHFEPGPGRSGCRHAVRRPRDLDRGAALRPRERAGRPGDGHGPPGMHRTRPSDGHARTLHRRRRGARWRRLRAARRRRRSLVSDRMTRPGSDSPRPGRQLLRSTTRCHDDSAPSDRVEHRRRQPARERVLLARVVGARAGVRPDRDLRAVPETRLRRRRRGPSAANARSAASHPNAPSATITRTGPSSTPSRGPGTARTCRVPRSSACWPAAHSGRRPRCTTSVSVRPSSARREAGRSARPASMERRPQEVARRVAGEDAARSGCRRAPPAPGRAAGSAPPGRRSPGTGRPQYVSSRNRRDLLAGDLLAPVDQPRTAPARDDLARSAPRAPPGRSRGHPGCPAT